MKKVLVIGGPTAVGKTALSIELAKKFNGEIISGDSMQVYKKLDIGTAKITPSEMENIPHYLIDIKEIEENYSAYDFQKEGRQLIDQISQRGHLPIIAGGTGLYIQTLLYDFQLGSTSKPKIDRKDYYQKLLDNEGSQYLWNELYLRDQSLANSIHPNNKQRIIRALEILDNGGQLQQSEKPKSLYDSKIIALNTERELLYQRINQRVDLMIEKGLVEEAKMVFDKGDVQGAKAIGYKELFPYFLGEESLDTCIEELKKQSRRYAKRQITWFNNRLNVEWYDLILNDHAKDNVFVEVERWLNE